MPLPAELTVVTVHGKWVKADGSPETGTVVFTPSIRMLSIPAADTLVTLTGYTATLNGTGEITVALPATDDADVAQTGWTWHLEERLSETTRHRDITVPAATVGTLQLADVADAVPGPASVTYALAAAVPTIGASVPLVASGSGSAGAASTVSRSDHVHPVNALSVTDQGSLLASNFPNWAAGASQTLSAAGTIQLAKIPIPAAMTIANVILSVGGVGVSLTAGQNMAALFGPNGALLSTTADQATNWQSAGVKVMALAQAQLVAAGYVYVGWFYNGGTSPGFTRSGSAPSGFANVGLSAANALHATADTGRTTSMPANLGALAASNNMFWAGVS